MTLDRCIDDNTNQDEDILNNYSYTFCKCHHFDRNNFHSDINWHIVFLVHQIQNLSNNWDNHFLSILMKHKIKQIKFNSSMFLIQYSLVYLDKFDIVDGKLNIADLMYSIVQDIHQHIVDWANINPYYNLNNLLNLNTSNKFSNIIRIDLRTEKFLRKENNEKNVRDSNFDLTLLDRLVYIWNWWV